MAKKIGDYGQLYWRLSASEEKQLAEAKGARGKIGGSATNFRMLGY